MRYHVFNSGPFQHINKETASGLCPTEISTAAAGDGVVGEGIHSTNLSKEFEHSQKQTFHGIWYKWRKREIGH